ncbi:putative defense protein 3 [Watersipora subatra]|uniref:putative defense protein 3 n=1 Tax=Watersipora subatra TaxID=2589382 RepID=UPI00355BB37F
MTMLRVLVTICIVFLPLAESYNYGAPSSTCDTLLPGHGVTAQNQLPTPIDSPFFITVDGPTVVSNNEPVTITLEGSGRSFEGFIIVGEYVGADNVRYRMGTWNSTNSLVKVTCDDGGGMTHTSNAQKSTVELLWWAPAEPFTGEVSFWGSFVETYNTYWTVLSGSVTVTVLPPTTTITTTVGQTTVGQTTVGQTTVGQTTVGQTTVGQTTDSQTTTSQQSPQLADLIPGFFNNQTSRPEVTTSTNSTGTRTETSMTVTPSKSASTTTGDVKDHPFVKSKTKVGRSQSNDDNGCSTLAVSLTFCITTCLLQFL